MNFIAKAILSVVVGYNYFQEDRPLSVETKVTGTSTDANGYPVIHVQAATYIEAASITEGTTYPGDVSRSIVHTGRNEWQIRIEPRKTE